AAGIVGAVARHVDGAAPGFERRALELRHRELDAAADRSAVGERARDLEQLVAELTRAGGVLDDRPVDHDLLRADARPFDEADRDPAVRTRPDGVHHLRFRECGRIAFAPRLDSRTIDAG